MAKPFKFCLERNVVPLRELSMHGTVVFVMPRCASEVRQCVCVYVCACVCAYWTLVTLALQQLCMVDIFHSL